MDSFLETGFEQLESASLVDCKRVLASWRPVSGLEKIYIFSLVKYTDQFLFHLCLNTTQEVKVENPELLSETNYENAYNPAYFKYLEINAPSENTLKVADQLSEYWIQQAEAVEDLIVQMDFEDPRYVKYKKMVNYIEDKYFSVGMNLLKALRLSRLDLPKTSPCYAMVTSRESSKLMDLKRLQIV